MSCVLSTIPIHPFLSQQCRHIPRPVHTFFGRTASDTAVCHGRINTEPQVVHPPSSSLHELPLYKFMTALWLDNLGSDQVIVTPYDLKKPTSDHTPNFTSIQTHTGAPLSPPTRNDFSRARNPENNHTNIITSSTLDLTQGNLTYEESENGLKVDGGRAGILPGA